MKNMFFYTRMEAVQPVIKGKEVFKPFKCSFNLEKVIRSEELENGHVLVLLDDLHQRPQQVEVMNKQGKVTAIKREMQTFQSEIFLTEPADIQNFYNLTNVIETDYTTVIQDKNTVTVY